METRIVVRREPFFGDRVDFLVKRRSERITFIAKPLEFVELPEMVCPSEPTLSIETSAAQNLMDELWTAGFRPTEGSGSAGAMSATQKHLEDMRTLVFQKKE